MRKYYFYKAILIFYIQTDEDDRVVKKTLHKISTEKNVNMISEQVIDEIVFLISYQI